MITEASNRSSLRACVVLYESELSQLRAMLRSLAVSLAGALQDGSLGAAQVVIHDNASSADYRRALQLLLDELADDFAPFGGLQVELAPDNSGYGGGANRALGGSDDTFLLVLNPDIELQQDAIGAGVCALRDNQNVVAVAPRCARADGSAEYLCKRYPAVFDLLLRGLGIGLVQAPFRSRLARYEYRDWDAAQPRKVELLSGAWMLMRGDAFTAVGGFDESYFMYFEDFDLSLRLRDRGVLRYEPAVTVVHHGGYASRKGWRHVRWFLTSATRFYRRHGWRLI